MARAADFLEFEIFDVRFRIIIPKDKKMGAVTTALPEKMVITTRPNAMPQFDTRRKTE